jgi:uncharacterized protein YutE (UPF0331/DUF86 family)
LVELRSLGSVTTADLLQDWRTRRAVERDLQVLVEVVIDLCQRLIALAGQTPATTSGDAVERCIAMGVIANREAYCQMVRFGNFLVHRYERVDVEILADRVNHHLEDFSQFRKEVLADVQC